MNFAQAFGRNLRRLRDHRGETQEGLAEAADVHRTVISKLESGKSEALASTILKLSGALEADPGEFFTGMTWKPPRSEPGSYELELPSE